MIVVATKDELKKAIDSSKTTALVMTMGALHDGHAHLIKEARAKAEQVVVSIYVNPLQFGVNEDYSKYPRTLEADVQLCEKYGVDIVFAPSDEQMYGATRQISLKVGWLATVYEGKTRPGHFDGVCQVVCKVLNLVKPDYAYFGQKDAQQLAVIKNMVHDLDIDVQICAVPIVRQADGLALSSRNQYLSQEQKQIALNIYKTLEFAREGLHWGSSVQEVVENCRGRLNQVEGLKLDYFNIVDPVSFEEVSGSGQSQVLAICAAYVGSTRLIDNLLIG